MTKKTQAGNFGGSGVTPSFSCRIYFSSQDDITSYFFREGVERAVGDVEHAAYFRYDRTELSLLQDKANLLFGD